MDDAAKVRVLQYIISRYNLSPTNNSLTSNIKSQENESVSIKMLTDSIDEGNEDRFQGMTTPSLRDVVLKSLPKSEVEWILIYAFYASEFGIKEFTRQDISALYESSKRKSGNTAKNFGSNISAVIRKNWMRSLNDNEYILESDGKNYALQILQGNSVAKPKKTVPNGKKTKREKI